MDQLRRQNSQLQKSIQQTLQQIQKQRELNTQHQSQIQTLLKFNERLLAIIQTELHNKKQTNSLQAISQRSQRDSQLFCVNADSVMKSIRMAAASRINQYPTSQSFVDRKHLPSTPNANPKQQKQTNLNRLMSFDTHKSEIQHSFDNQDISQYKREQSQRAQNTFKGVKVPTHPNIPQIDGTIVQQRNQVQNQMSKQLQNLKKFKEESNKFYQQKIGEIRNLSDKLSKYKPIDQFTQISQKLNISAATSKKIQAAIQKNQK